MRRVLIRRPGGYERLQIVEQDGAEPEAGQVRIDVRAVGVNFADCVVRMGLYQSARKFVGWPITPGFEFAGVVRSSRSSAFRAGDHVFGVTRFGAYQTEVVVGEAQLFPMPEAFGFEQAACFPVAFLTAWYALRELAGQKAGQRVLIHSAAGGVGLAAVQIAKALGGVVIGVVGMSHKVEVAKHFGCDVVIDSSKEPLWNTLASHCPDGVDRVLDPNGERTLKGSYDSLRPMGRLIIYGFQSMLPKGRGKPSWPKLAYTYLKTPRFDPLSMTNENKSVMAFNLSYLFEQLGTLQGAMRELLGWIASEQLRPLPWQGMPFEQVADAHRALESGTTTGRLVLTIEPGR